MMIPSDSVSFKDFVNSLHIDFNSKDIIPFVDSDENWQEIGNIIATSNSFANRGVPTTENFLSWKEWGIILYDTMAR